MSVSYEYSYALQAAARRTAYLNRISKTTESFYNQYIEKYEKMKQEGLVNYIPAEMERLESDLSQIRSLLISDPEEARDISFSVGMYIRSMSSLASEARAQFERAERVRAENLKTEKEHAKNELLQEYFEIVKSITNPIVVNFSITAMQEVKKQIETGKITNSNQLRKRTEDIKNEAEGKADEWKEITVKKNKKETVLAVIDETEERIKREILENKEKTQQFLDNISKMRKSLESGESDISDIEKKVSDVSSAVDEELISEETRREAVKAIIKQLNSQDFHVEKPQIITTDDKNYVKIVAKQPSGKRAICNVDLHGKLAYKFDNYEGMTCLKDIEKFNVDLEKIYSIKLSDERVLWQNPDRLQKDADSIPKMDGRKA